jgi:hypothetical protein
LSELAGDLQGRLMRRKRIGRLIVRKQHLAHLVEADRQLALKGRVLGMTALGQVKANAQPLLVALQRLLPLVQEFEQLTQLLIRYRQIAFQVGVIRSLSGEPRCDRQSLVLRRQRIIVLPLQG